ncbi:hypothetical protein [Hugenholtzia roseola]|uniref:hypothetical protein n=1 Tax=Hugenholtzia roseola TaxID=1002 RepID=UPI0012B5E1E8|nr:hypothetical protein [Hugenholtzia roseola]
MMKAIILQSENEADLSLLVALANRLGVSCQVFVPEEQAQSAPSPHLEADTYNSDALFEGLGLDEEITPITFEEFCREPLSLDTTPNATNISEVLKQVGGAWEDDDEETLEQLLNQLTP